MNKILNSGRLQKKIHKNSEFLNDNPTLTSYFSSLDEIIPEIKYSYYTFS